MKLLKNRWLGFLLCLFGTTIPSLAQDLKFEPDTSFHSDFDFELSEALAADSLVAFMEEDSISLDLPDLNYIPKIHMDVVADRMACLDATIPFTVNKTVCGFINFFLVRKRNYTQTMLERQDYYFPVFEKYLAANNMPDELKYLSVVESGLKFDAKSRTGAMGLWQFMPGTGRDFRMTINNIVDERMHLEKSTEGACRFLKILYNQFGDWELALAAYNCGPGNVRKAIRNSGGRTFWEVYNHLPQETRSYVPQFIAVVYAMNFAAEHNLYADADSMMRRIEVDTIRPAKHLDLIKLEKLLEVDSNTIRLLNPHLHRNIYACNLPYPLCIPAEKKEHFWAKALEDSAATELPTAKVLPNSSTRSGQWVYHKTKKNESLTFIAQKYGCTVAQLRQWNHLKSAKVAPRKRSLKVRFELTEAPVVLAKAKTKQKDSVATNLQKAENVNQELVEYVVEKQENLFSIGRKFNMSSEELMSLNNLSNENIIAGQRLLVKKSVQLIEATELKTEPEPVLVSKNRKVKQDTFELASKPQHAEEEIPANELIHKVEKGQGLYTISRMYGVEVSQLIAWNQLRNESIKAGQTLVIKQSQGQGISKVNRKSKSKRDRELNVAQPGLKFYRVQKGDTIYSITRKYAISAQELIKKNNLKSKVLKPGQKLIIS